MSQGAIIPLDLVKIIAFHATINTKLAMICTCKRWYNELNENDQVWRDEIAFYRNFIPEKLSARWGMYWELKQITKSIPVLLELLDGRLPRFYRISPALLVPAFTKMLGRVTLKSLNWCSVEVSGRLTYNQDVGLRLANDGSFVLYHNRIVIKQSSPEEIIWWLETELNHKLGIF